MTTPPSDAARELSQAVSESWLRFLDVCEPLRPVLYRYCRSLTRSPWDADDLVQDAMARGFVTLGCMREAPPNPRAWLFRIASHLWIDRVRRQRQEPGPVPEKAVSQEPRAARVLGIRAQVTLVEPRSIARSEGKARRVIDQRQI